MGGSVDSGPVTTLMLVHGAFHGSWCWDPLLAELAARQVDACAVDLPFTTLADDEATVVAAVEAQHARGEQVVLLGHSFGGAVISGAGGIGAAARPGVAHLIYLTAVLTSPEETLSIEPSPGMGALRYDGDVASVDPDGAVAAFYHRCPPQDAIWATSRLRGMPAATLTAPSSAAAWRVVPSTYIVCTDDQMIGADDQRRMAARATTSHELDSDHSPFLACPAALADILEQIVRRI